MPRSAHAQLYLGLANGPVGQYNASTGAAINANLITGIVNKPVLAASGNTLFVSNQAPDLFAPFGTVFEYDASTGAAINATETGSVTTVGGTATVTFPTPFSQVPNVTFDLLPPFIAATPTNQTTTGFVVNAVDTSTGLPANATVTWVAIGGYGGITGLNGFPTGLAVSGNTLFVATVPPSITGVGAVGAYNATTGAAINPNFIPGLNLPGALAVSGNTLFVYTGGGVGTYDATTGTLINPSFIPARTDPTSIPQGLAVSGDTLFMLFSAGSAVASFDATTGALRNPNLIPAPGPAALAVLGSTLFVASLTPNSTVVGAYNATTGAAINANLISIAGTPFIPIGLAVANPTIANPITATDLSLRRDLTGPNNIHITPGDRIELSATVTPNGNAGTTGTGQTTNLSTGQPHSAAIPYVPLTANLNYFNLTIPYDPNLTGPWTVTFSNDAATPTTATAVTDSIEGVAPAPTPINVTVSGSTLNPTFCWSYPPSVTGLQINIYDTAVLIGGRVDNVFSVDVPVTRGCYTLPTILDGGYTLTPGTTYVIDLKARVLFDPTGPNVDSNTAAQSQTYFTFTPASAGTQPLLYLPTIESNGVYHFNLTVQPNTTYFIDPTVATGFTYAIGAGDPNFATVVLPSLQGATPYTISWDNGLHAAQVLGGATLNFLQTDPLGVSTFTVTGINPADGLDPTSGTEFVTGLSFVSAGSFTGTMAPITTLVLPPVVPPSQVATTASGLAYSRVSQTFNGSLTLRNVSGSAISGPLQILFTGLPAGVTLVNATNNLAGTPYLTVPALASLAPGQSVTVSVQFKNPSNAAIIFTPVIYSGSF